MLFFHNTTSSFNTTNPKRVSRYSPAGYLGDLPRLNRGRSDHGCAGYEDGEGRLVLLVAGGWGWDEIEDNYLSSTETFTVGVSGSWSEVSPLPLGLINPRAAVVDNIVYLFGESLLLSFLLL